MTSGDLPRAFLALPAEGEVGFLRLQRRLRLLAARALLSHPLGDLPDDLAAGLHAFRPSLTMALKAHSGPVLAAIGRPDVLPHLLCLQDGVGAEEAAQCLQVAVPALMAALAGQSQIQLRWTAPVRRVVDPQHHRVVVFDPPVDGLVAQAEGLMAVQGRNRWGVGPDRPGVQISHAHRPIRSDLPNLHLALPLGDSVDEASISACLSCLKTGIGLAGAGPASVVARGAAQFGPGGAVDRCRRTRVHIESSTSPRSDGRDGRRFPNGHRDFAHSTGPARQARYPGLV